MAPSDPQRLTAQDLEAMSQKLRALIEQAQEVRDDVNRRLVALRLAGSPDAPTGSGRRRKRR